MSELRFITGNTHKISEATAILESVGVTIVPLKLKIDELQTADSAKLVRDKVLKAYRYVGRPLFVEHTGLHLEHLHGLPGGLTETFWETLKADQFADLFGKPGQNTTALARTIIGYCDSCTITLFAGEIAGDIVPPRGNRDFQWDCIFQPKGFGQTFAEMGVAKNDISMRKLALDLFLEHLRNAGAKR